MNLKYGPKAQVPNFDYISPIELILPITLRSYLQFLVINEAEFHQKYNTWKSQNNFHLTRNLLLDKKALNNEPQLSAILPSFLPLQPSPKVPIPHTIVLSVIIGRSFLPQKLQQSLISTEDIGEGS